MIVRTEQLTFRGAAAGAITAHLDLPEGEPIACALLAHRFDPSTGAAERISRGLSELGVAVLRLEHPELSDGYLLAAAAALRERLQAPRFLIGHGDAGAPALAAAARIAEARAVALIGAPSDPARLGDLPELRKALLLLHAPGDLTVPIDHARRLFEAARHPKSFVSLDGADHHLSRHEDAAFVANVLSAWASRYLRQGEAATWMPGERLPPGEGQVVVAETREGAYTQAVQIGSHRLAADEPRRLGGLDAGPAPYDYLLAALGACTSMTVRMYAERKQWPLERAVVRLRHDKIHAEDCADCETKAGKVDHIAREIELQGELSEEQRARLMEIADKCPVHRTLHGEVKINTALFWRPKVRGQSMESMNHLPNMFVNGPYVLSMIFNTRYLGQADVVVSGRGITTSEIRSRLGVITDCSLNVQFGPPRFVLNCDYWVIDDEGVLRTLDKRYPVDKHLRVLADLTPEDSIRLVALAATFPWVAVDPRIRAAVMEVEALHTDDAVAAELIAGRWTDMPWAKMLDLVKETRTHDT